MNYDLSTVKILLPGRFAIAATRIDNPDIIRGKIAAIISLRKYCDRPIGTYNANIDTGKLGAPDMDLEPVVVSRGVDGKFVYWFLPYHMLALGQEGDPIFLSCASWAGVTKTGRYGCLSSRENRVVLIPINLHFGSMGIFMRPN